MVLNKVKKFDTKVRMRERVLAAEQDSSLDSAENACQIS